MDWFKAQTQLEFEETEGYLLVNPQGRCDLALGGQGSKVLGSASLRIFTQEFLESGPRETVPGLSFRFSIEDIQDFLVPVQTSLSWVAPSKSQFEGRVRDVKRQFASTVLKKVVPVVRWVQPRGLSRSEVKALLTNILLYFQRSRPRGYVYAAWNAGGGFMGLSPEILFQIQGSTLTTMALAGTSWSDKQAADLEEDPKEAHEHEVVVLDLLQKLRRFGNFQSQERQRLRYGRLDHLLTPIKGTLFRKDSLQDLIKTLHPSAALGGFPYEPARHWLAEQPEAQWRGFFGAPLTWLFEDQAVSVVMIRGLFWNQHETYLPCGCGIVADSDPEQEWRELLQKQQSVMEVLSGGRSES